MFEGTAMKPARLPASEPRLRAMARQVLDETVSPTHVDDHECPRSLELLVAVKRLDEPGRRRFRELIGDGREPTKGRGDMPDVERLQVRVVDNPETQASILVVTHDGKDILREEDDFESGDATFLRSLAWVPKIIREAYLIGRSEGRVAQGETSRPDTNATYDAVRCRTCGERWESHNSGKFDRCVGVKPGVTTS